MYVSAEDLDPASTYRLLVGSVVPRPIAWVTSGVDPTNLAPFSSFAWVSQFPAMLGFTVMPRPGGVLKDTIRNIESDGEYVVNIAHEGMLTALHRSSERFAPEVSEATVLDLALAPSRIVAVPRLAEAPISMEVVHEQTLHFSAEGGSFVVGRVVAWHVDDAVLQNGRIDTALLRPIGRLAGPRYTGLGVVTELPPVPGG